MAEQILDRLFVLSDGSRILWRHSNNQWEIIDVEGNRMATELMRCIDETVRHAILSTAMAIETDMKIGPWKNHNPGG